MDKKEAYQQKLEGKLNEWQADIDKMKAKADQASGETKLEYERQLESLREHRSNAEAKLKELRDSSGRAWEDIKEGAEKAWNSAEDALASARRQFK